MLKNVPYRCTAARRPFTMDELLTALEISENELSLKDDCTRSFASALLTKVRFSYYIHSRGIPQATRSFA